jgi:hypothetical protein
MLEILEIMNVIEELLVAEPREIDEVFDIVEGLGFKVLNWTRLEGDTYMVFAVSNRTGIPYTIYMNIPVESELDIIINIM